jgi:diguanylate cyclase (GGDEF)-like protein
MLGSILLALEYDLVAFWDDLDEPQRRLRVEEVFLLTVLLAAGLAVFALRRLKEARLDIEREMRAETNRTLAMQDALTGLPNRRGLEEALAAALGRPPLGAGGHAFYLLDLNGFKQVNDGHGHAAGDALLRVVAERFRAAARKEDLVARLGGDEFAVLACNVGNRDQAALLGQRFVSALDERIASGGRSHAVGVSVGVALYPDDGTTVDEIMHHADLAMYMAKETKDRSSLQFYQAA